MAGCLTCTKTRCQVAKCNQVSPAILNNKETQLTTFNNSRRDPRETSSLLIIPCKYKTLTITNTNILIRWIRMHGLIEWAMEHGITLNSLIWWVIRTSQACKATNSNRSGWHHLIMAVIHSIAWIILSNQLTLKWCNLTNSHLRAMNSNKISRLSSKISRYPLDSPNSTHSSPSPLNSLVACLRLPLTFRCLLTTPYLLNKWCIYSSSNPLFQQQHPLLRLTQLQLQTSCISNKRSSLTLPSPKMETNRVSKKKSMHSKTPVLEIAQKISWGLPTSPKRLRSPDNLVRKIARLP